MSDVAEIDPFAADWSDQPEQPRVWEAARKSAGALETGEDLRKGVVEYFEWVHANPLFEDVVKNSRDGIVHEAVAKMRAPTIKGLCLFLGITPDRWDRWRSHETYKDVCAWADDTIFTMKFEGAAAGLLNPNIIMRELGLAEKTETEVSGKDGGPIRTLGVTIDVSRLTTEQLEAIATIPLKSIAG